MSLISKFRYNKVTVELHVLPSLLTISSVDCSRFLVTSANEYLLGARLPYFPRGGLSGPGPCNVQGEFQTWQSSGGWGGLSAGPGMVYPVQSLDGEVHRTFGGRNGELRRWIRENIALKSCDKEEKVGRRLRRDSDRVLCRTGDSVWSPIFCQDETLSRRFSEGLLHTVAPYNSDPDRDSALQSCYHNSLRLASHLSGPRAPRVVTALLGTGVKEVSQTSSTEALCRALTSLTRHQPGWECHLELVLQPLPETDIEGVCQTLESSLKL